MEAVQLLHSGVGRCLFVKFGSLRSSSPVQPWSTATSIGSLSFLAACFGAPVLCCWYSNCSCQSTS